MKNIIYPKPLAKITHNLERVDAFLLMSGPRQRCTLSLFTIILEVLSLQLHKKINPNCKYEKGNQIFIIYR